MRDNEREPPDLTCMPMPPHTPLPFFQGNGTSVLHRFPYAGINFFCYEHFKEYLGDGAHRHLSLSHCTR